MTERKRPDPDEGERRMTKRDRLEKQEQQEEWFLEQVREDAKYEFANLCAVDVLALDPAIVKAALAARGQAASFDRVIAHLRKCATGWIPTPVLGEEPFHYKPGESGFRDDAQLEHERRKREGARHA